MRPPQTGFQWEQADPLTTFDVRRFNAVRGYQAQQSREIRSCLKELRDLRKEALAACTSEPEPWPENEPKSSPPPANDDAVQAASAKAGAGEATLPNEPEDRELTDLGAHAEPDSVLRPWPDGAGRSVQTAGGG